MATFHFKLLENFLEVQVQNTVWALGLQPPSIFFWLIYSNVLLGPICKSHQLQSRNGGEEQNGHVRKWYKTCGAEVKAWVASVIWWCLAKNQTLE